jgi:hypothetical protein
MNTDEFGDFRVRAEDWCTRLLVRWRSAWREADETTRAELRGQLFDLHAPVRINVIIEDGDRFPVTGSMVHISPSAEDRDLVTCSLLDEDGKCIGGVEPRPQLANSLHGLVLVMRENWTPGRRADPPPTTRDLSATRISDHEVTWLIPGKATYIDVDELVTCVFDRASRPTSVNPPAPASPGSHGYALREKREDTMIRRWLGGAIGADQLLGLLGVTGLRWCALNLPRCDLLPDAPAGDIDVVAGPMEFDFDETEFTLRVNREKEGLPLAAQPSWAYDFAVRRACAEGHLVWPPRVDEIVACEVKASWYHPTEKKWKATHARKGTRVKGQLRLLLDNGFNRVAFLHIGVTKPRDEANPSPWFRAARDASVAEHQMKLVYDPADLPDCGYFRCVVGAVAAATEEKAAAEAPLTVIQPCRSRPQGSDVRLKGRLRDRLELLPRPRVPQVFVQTCPKCERWYLASAEARQDCEHCR